MVENQLEIKTWEDQKRPGFRWWSVEGFSPLPCGGLHVKNTSEIGKVNIKLKSLGKQGIRVYGTLG